jgi:lipid-binding SYLF domain-containing protein
MKSLRHNLQTLILAVAAAASLATALSCQAGPSTEAELKANADSALHALYRTNPAAENISHTAKAILVFPNIVKAGLVFGGSYGEGVLFKGGKFSGFYNSVSGSWGWQLGAQSYGYVLFLMNDKAVNYLEKTEGWEIGVGPSVVAVNEGVAKNLTTTTLKDDAYAFIFDQKGLMASLSIEGTKISHIKVA